MHPRRAIDDTIHVAAIDLAHEAEFKDAAAAVAGLQSAGVAACAKHFPGHGSTSVDSHHALATVTGPMNLIWARDLPPFVAAIEAGVRAVMPGHLRIAGLTGAPRRVQLPASARAPNPEVTKPCWLRTVSAGAADPRPSSSRSCDSR